MSWWEVAVYVVFFSSLCYGVINLTVFLVLKRRENRENSHPVDILRTDMRTPEDFVHQDPDGNWQPVCDRCERFVPVVVAYPRYSRRDAEAGLCGVCWRVVHPQIFDFDGDPFAVREERYATGSAHPVNYGAGGVRRFRGRP